MIARILVVLGLVAAVAHAQPQTSDQLAKQRYEHGKQLVAAHQFAAAYDEFAAGFDLSNRPQFLFNMGECKRALGDAAAARDLYQRYLTTSPQGELAETARQRLVELGPAPSHAPAPPPPPPPPTTSPPIAPAKLDLRAQPAEPVVATHPVLIVPEQPSQPIWRRTPFWIGVGTAVVVGSVAIYAATRHDNSCPSPMCIDLR